MRCDACAAAFQWVQACYQAAVRALHPSIILSSVCPHVAAAGATDRQRAAVDLSFNPDPVVLHIQLFSGTEHAVTSR